MDPCNKKVKYDTAVGQEMTDFLVQFEKETVVPAASTSHVDISQTLLHLEEDITCIRSCLEKPKSKRVNLNEINRKVDLILEILNSLITPSHLDYQS